MLDSRPQATCRPQLARLLEGVEGVAVGEVADRVDGNGKPCGGRAPDDVRELLLARDLDPRPVEVVGPEGASLGIVDREAVARVLD